MNQFSEEAESTLNKAFALLNANRHKEALEIFLSLESHYANSSVLNGMIATCYYLSADYKNSEVYFRKTTLLNPKSELASRGLFHSLWSQGKFRKATDEMKRFLSSYEPVGYKILIEELYEHKEDQSIYCQKVIDKYYQKFFLHRI